MIHKHFEDIHANLCRHVSISPQRRLGSSHSTGSLEGVTFLAVAIEDKLNMDFLDNMIYFTLLSALEFLNYKFVAPSMNSLFIMSFLHQNHKTYHFLVLG